MFVLTLEHEKLTLELKEKYRPMKFVDQLTQFKVMDFLTVVFEFFLVKLEFFLH